MGCGQPRHAALQTGITDWSTWGQRIAVGAPLLALDPYGHSTCTLGGWYRPADPDPRTQGGTPYHTISTGQARAGTIAAGRSWAEQIAG